MNTPNTSHPQKNPSLVKEGPKRLPYQKPSIQSEALFESAAGGVGKDPDDFSQNCDVFGS